MLYRERGLKQGSRAEGQLATGTFSGPNLGLNNRKIEEPGNFYVETDVGIDVGTDDFDVGIFRAKPWTKPMANIAILTRAHPTTLVLLMPFGFNGEKGCKRDPRVSHKSPMLLLIH